GVEQQRDPEGHGEEDRFAGDEDHQLPALRVRERLVADATADELSEIIKKLPLDGQQSVKRPEVEVLPPVIRETPLMRSQPGEEDGRLQVHLPAVAWPAAGGSKILLDPAPQLELEGVAVRKF